MRRWWDALRDWLPSSELSLVTIAINDDPIMGVRRLRKGLRDVRDRAALHDARWAAVKMAGMFSNDELLLLIHHLRINHRKVEKTLQRRWSNVIVLPPDARYPSWAMTVDHALALGLCRRGIAPLRIVIPAKRLASGADADWDQPMPMVF